MTSKELGHEKIGVVSAAMQNTHGGYFIDKIATRFMTVYVRILTRRGKHVR